MRARVHYGGVAAGAYFEMQVRGTGRAVANGGGGGVGAAGANGEVEVAHFGGDGVVWVGWRERMGSGLGTVPEAGRVDVLFIQSTKEWSWDDGVSSGFLCLCRCKSKIFPGRGLRIMNKAVHGLRHSWRLIKAFAFFFSGIKERVLGF